MTDLESIWGWAIWCDRPDVARLCEWLLSLGDPLGMKANHGSTR